ncbi:Uncharacterised protein [Mycobacteroides abscessus subsp. abscessus]|nr:Uncharacterised protein [Mycobacteroides abscessus subsp. abscessus]
MTCEPTRVMTPKPSMPGSSLKYVLPSSRSVRIPSTFRGSL